MVNYAALQSSINTAVDDYESYKSQSLRLNLENISLGTSTTLDSSNKSPGKSHAKRASLAIPGLARFNSSDNKSSTRPTQLRTQSDDSLHEQPLQSPFNSTFTGDRRPTSPSIHASSPSKREFAVFISVATEYETTNHLLDMDFLESVFDFMRRKRTSSTDNSLTKLSKERTVAKKRLWNAYTAEMQGLARAYASGKPLSTPSSSPFASSSQSSSKQQQLQNRKASVRELMGALGPADRTCAESIFSATTHLYAQAIKDIHARYAMPDPINDKTTSIERHNERVRVFNQLVRFVCEDLNNLEKTAQHGGTPVPAPKKEKKGSMGVVDAVKSLHVEDYPPYGK